MTEHSGTHIDALCHQAYDGRLHGGVAVTAEVQTPTGFTALGIDTVAPIVRRGVLLDVAAAACPTAGHRRRPRGAAGVELRPGDVVARPARLGRAVGGSAGLPARRAG